MTTPEPTSVLFVHPGFIGDHTATLRIEPFPGLTDTLIRELMSEMRSTLGLTGIRRGQADRFTIQWNMAGLSPEALEGADTHICTYLLSIRDRVQPTPYTDVVIVPAGKTPLEVAVSHENDDELRFTVDPGLIDDRFRRAVVYSLATSGYPHSVAFEGGQIVLSGGAPSDHQSGEDAKAALAAAMVGASNYQPYFV